jgi:hypothetical protein
MPEIANSRPIVNNTNVEPAKLNDGDLRLDAMIREAEQRAFSRSKDGASQQEGQSIFQPVKPSSTQEVQTPDRYNNLPIPLERSQVSDRQLALLGISIYARGDQVVIECKNDNFNIIVNKDSERISLNPNGAGLTVTVINKPDQGGRITQDNISVNPLGQWRMNQSTLLSQKLPHISKVDVTLNGLDLAQMKETYKAEFVQLGGKLFITSLGKAIEIDAKVNKITAEINQQTGNLDLRIMEKPLSNGSQVFTHATIDKNGNVEFGKKELIAEKAQIPIASLISISKSSPWVDKIKVNQALAEGLQWAKQCGYNLEDNGSKSNGFYLVKNGAQLGEVTVFMNNNWQAELLELINKQRIFR